MRMPKWLYDNLLTRWRAGRELKYLEKLEREHLEGLGQHQASKETYNISSQCGKSTCCTAMMQPRERSGTDRVWPPFSTASVQTR